MSIEAVAPPSPQPKAASTGLWSSSLLEAGPQDGASVDDADGFSTLLAALTKEMGDPEPAAAQHAVPDGAKEDLPLTPPAVPPALDLAALLALAGQAEAARVTADAQTDAPLAQAARGSASKNGLKTAKPEEVSASALSSVVPGPAEKAPLLDGKIAVADPQSVTPDPIVCRQSAASVARAAEKLEIQGARLEAFSREPGLAALLAASGLRDGLVRQSGANSDKPLGRFALSSFEGSGGVMPAATGASGEIMAPPEVVTVQTTDTMLADTVSYWVSQGVQKAELKLDGFGAEPIEVSISLANGEAQIGFRTDRADVRDVIEGAMSHLKELLASEGLVLAGVSVGTAGQDRAGAQAQRERAGTRHKGISLVEPDVALSAPRARGVSGRTVDLFV